MQFGNNGIGARDTDGPRVRTSLLLIMHMYVHVNLSVHYVHSMNAVLHETELNSCLDNLNNSSKGPVSTNVHVATIGGICPVFKN